MFKAVLFIIFLFESARISVSGDDGSTQTCLIKPFIDATIQNYKLENADWKEKLEGKVASAEKEIDKLKNLETAMVKIGAALEKSVSEVYTRWGSKTCPETADTVYSGYTAGSLFSHHGGGAHPVCLHINPTLDKHKTVSGKYTYIYGSEYKPHDGSLKNDHDVPCTVCRTKGRSTVHMTPGKKTCEDDTWTTEYDGYLMTGHHTHQGRTAFTCIDKSMDTITGGHKSANGQLFYYVRPQCGALECPPYNAGNTFYLKCVVCSK